MRHGIVAIGIGLALSGAPSAHAGSVRLTAEWPQASGGAAGAPDASPIVVELDRAAESFKRGELDACLQQLGRAVETQPELPPAHALLAKLAFQYNQASLIRPALERAVVEGPDHPEVFILFGDVALLEGRLTDAAVHFEKARMLATAGGRFAAQKDRFDRLCHQGEASIAEGRGDWKSARSALEGWLKHEPANAPARHRLGKALFHLGHHGPAYQELKRASDEERTLEPASITMVWLYSREGDPTKAQEWMDFAIRSDPRSHAIRVGLAAWLLGQGRDEEALAHAGAAIQLDPRSIEARRLLGLAARARQDFARSEAVFRALVNESPNDAWARTQLALVLAEQDDQAKRRQALELAERTAREAPEAADTLSTLGTVYYRLRRLDEAEKLLRAIVDSGRASSDATYILARLEADRGRAAGVPTLLKSALDAPGLFIARNDARRWLDRLTAARP
jgi:tetratricopeptide (TPR) repeat protein